MSTMSELFDRADREAASDLKIAKRSEKWSQAVTHLRAWLTPNVQQQIRELVNIKSTDWPAGYHSFWGMGVRNELRQAGYGEQEFGVMNLDNIYIELIEEAVRRTVSE